MWQHRNTAKGNIAKGNITEARLDLAVQHLGPHMRYVSVKAFPFNAQLRWSNVPRRTKSDGTDVLDVDLVSISADTLKGKGLGTRFFKSLMRVAQKRGRGVFLEQAITPASQGLGRKLVQLGLATAQPDGMSFLSVYPPPG